MTNSLPPPMARRAPTSRPSAGSLAKLAAGQLAVLFAGQAWFVILTWLLVASGAGGKTGLVLMFAAVPRALLMLVGGAVSDRVPPIIVLRVAALSSTVIFAVGAIRVAAGDVSLWEWSLIAGLLGICDAFFFPAIGALVPQVAAGAQRQKANAFVQLSDQITQIAGPLAAGVLLSRTSAGLAIAALAGAAGLGVVLFGSFRVRRPPDWGTNGPFRESVGRSVAHGLTFAWANPDVRALLGIAAVLSLGTVGPISVGGALLASERFGGAQALGFLLGAFGLGALIGVGIAAATKPTTNVRVVLGLTTSAIGVGFGMLGLAKTLAVAIGVAIPTGMAAGYLGVFAVSVLQSRTPASMQGRMSSLLMFAFFALDPVSQGLAGILVGFGPTVLFSNAAGLLFLSGLAVLPSRSAPAAEPRCPIPLTKGTPQNDLASR